MQMPNIYIHHSVTKKLNKHFAMHYPGLAAEKWHLVFFYLYFGKHVRVDQSLKFSPMQLTYTMLPMLWMSTNKNNVNFLCLI